MQLPGTPVGSVAAAVQPECPDISSDASPEKYRSIAPAPFLTRQALREELQAFSEGTLRQELGDFITRLINNRTEIGSPPYSGKLGSPSAAAGYLKPAAPNRLLVAPQVDPPEIELDDDDHEWTLRQMRRYQTHGLLAEDKSQSATTSLPTTPNDQPLPETPAKVLVNGGRTISCAEGKSDTGLSGSQRPDPPGSPDVGTGSAPLDDLKRSGPSDHVTSFGDRFIIPVKCLVRQPAFDYVVGVLVLINSALIGIQTDVVARQNLKSPPFGFRVCETCFTLAFTVELVFRLIAYGDHFFKMRSWQWNVFDCVIVSLQVTEEFLTIVLFGYSSGESALRNFSVVRVLRLLRFVRIIRLVRVLRLVGELRVLVTSITRSWRPLCWTMVLLTLNMYLFGVYFTQLVHDNRIDSAAAPGGDPTHGFSNSDAALQHYFGSLGMSFLSLFQAITGGKDWDDISYPLLDVVSPVGCMAFCLYIAFTVIAMMNVVTGVFVESSIKSAKEDKDFFMINNMREVFKAANAGGSGHMTLAMFESQLDKSNMVEYFRAIDVDPSEARGLFRLLDLDGSGSINAEEFLSGCLRLRGPAKALDLALLQHEVRRMITRIQDQKRFLEGQLTAGRSLILNPSVQSPSLKSYTSLRSPTDTFATHLVAGTSNLNGNQSHNNIGQPPVDELVDASGTLSVFSGGEEIFPGPSNLREAAGAELQQPSTCT